MQITISTKTNDLKINMTSLKRKSYKRVKSIVAAMLYIGTISLSGFILAWIMDFLYTLL